MAIESTLAETILVSLLAEQTRYERQRKMWMQCAPETPRLWSQIDEDEVANWVNQEIASTMNALGQAYNANTLKGVMYLLRIRSGFVLPRPSNRLIPCANGVLDLDARTLRDYTPDDGFTWAVPYNYEAQVTCPKIQKWLSETVQSDGPSREVLRAYLRAILTSRVDLEKYLELIGPGGRGKGTYTRLAQAMVGTTNTDVSNLKTLEGNRFETAGLVDKKLLILNDEERFTGSVSTLKALTGEDTIRIERKHQDKANAPNLCMILISANEPILSHDYTSGLARRRITMNFINKVQEPKPLLSLYTGIPTGDLADELPGLLNWVIDMKDEEMVSWLTTLSGSQATTKAMMLMETNPMAAWAEEQLMVTDDLSVPIYIGVARRMQPLPSTTNVKQPLMPMDEFEKEDEWLYASYRGWMLRAGFKEPVSSTRFSSLLVDLCREQLCLEVSKPPKDAKGNHLVGIRFRDLFDVDKPGLITDSIGKTVSLQTSEGLNKATT